MAAMTDDEFRAAVATMPWREHSYQKGKQVIIQILDKDGYEVPLLTLTAFIVRVSARMGAANKEKQNG